MTATQFELFTDNFFWFFLNFMEEKWHDSHVKLYLLNELVSVKY